MKTQVPKSKFSGAEKKLQKAAAKHVALEDQNRVKDMLGEEVFRDAVHFGRFNTTTGDFYNSRVVKRFLTEMEEGTFVPDIDRVMKSADLSAAFRLDPMFIHCLRGLYSTFENAAKAYYLGGANEQVCNTLRKSVRRHQPKIIEYMKL